MIIHTYEAAVGAKPTSPYLGRNILEYADYGCHIFEKDSGSVGLGVFLWGPVNSLGMHSLFLGSIIR